jgi:hypothetical protein
MKFNVHTEEEITFYNVENYSCSNEIHGTDGKIHSDGLKKDMKTYSEKSKQDSSVGIGLDHGLDNRGSRVRFLA